MQRRLQDPARLLVGTDDVDRVSDRGHRLLEDEDFVFLAEVANEHQDFLAGHKLSSQDDGRPRPPQSGGATPRALMKERRPNCNWKGGPVQMRTRVSRYRNQTHAPCRLFSTCERA